MATKNEKRYALITGATSGIGYELAKLFAKDGYNIVAVSRTMDDLDRIAEEFSQQYGVEVVSIVKDLFNSDAAMELYEEIKGRNLTVDVLVNDAGQGQYGLFIENDIQRQLDIIQLNIASLTAITYYFLKDMVARNEGKILQLASIASESPGPYQAEYHATKAYVLSFSQALAEELRNSGVTVTALCPGPTATEFASSANVGKSGLFAAFGIAHAEDVAKFGVAAMMHGKRVAIPGIKNKIVAQASRITPRAVSTRITRMAQESR